MNPDNLGKKALKSMAKQIANGDVPIGQFWDEHYESSFEYMMTNLTWRNKIQLGIVHDLKMEYLLSGVPDTAIGSVSDAIEGQCGKSLGFGHSAGYWRKVVSTDVDPSGYQSTHNQPLEFFAEYCDGIAANPKSLEQMRKMFPNACDVCAEIIEELLKL